MVSGVAGAVAGLAEPPIAASVISGDAVIAWGKIVLLLDVVLVGRDLCLICPDCICLLERLRVLAAELVAVLLLFGLEPWRVELVKVDGLPSSSGLLCNRQQARS